MRYGYHGQILKVDLTSERISVIKLSDDIYRRYIGGSALASYLLLNELKPGINPLSKDNILVFTCSPLTGLAIPGASRFTVAAKSPLTGAFGEAEAGGWWGPQLKKAGYDGIVISGCATAPVYLWIHNGQAELKDAKHLTGKSTKKVEIDIRKELNEEKAVIAQCGSGGENLVRYACILNEAKHVNGRTGLGAVMGSKNLRAVAVRGTNSIPVANKEKIKELVKAFGKNWINNPINSAQHELGTAAGVNGLNKLGILPSYNFKDGEFEGANNISGETLNETLSIGNEGCYGCPIKCKRVVKSSNRYNIDSYYGGPEYETIGGLGSLCGIDDLEAVAKGNELCNKYGIDTISTAVTIAFAMECYEKGIINKEDTGGLELGFGNSKNMIELIRLIANRKGIGDILAEGTFRAARVFGKGADKFAMQVKKQELPLHEPRGKIMLALGYAVSPTGADHMETPHDQDYANDNWILENAAPLGLHETIDPLEISSRKMKMFCYLQNLWNMYNCLSLCDFVTGPKYTFTIENIVDLVRAVTGWRTSLWDLLKVGERANTMARCFNIREGFGPEDDTLPDRFFDPMGKGALNGKYIDRNEFSKAIKTYYNLQGWDENGIPYRYKLDELDLGWIDLTI